MTTEPSDIIAQHRCRERGMVCDEGELWCDTCKAIVNEGDVAHHQLTALAAAGFAVIKLPVVAFKGPHDTDASMLRTAADKAESARYPVGGSNVGRAVADVLRQAAAAAEVSR